MWAGGMSKGAVYVMLMAVGVAIGLIIVAARG